MNDFTTPDNIISKTLSPVHRFNKVAADPHKLLKQGIWAYFLLLIFEGALRKWFLPALSSPLLIIRDPLAIWILFMANKKSLLVPNPYLFPMIIMGVISIFTSIFLGHGSLPIAIYGARIILIHFPLIFVIGRIFNRDDVLQMGKVMLWMTIPMTLLIVIQFYSPQSAWVNRGVGGDIEGAGFSGALGFYRPPATFSFATGTYYFYSLVACYILYFWINPKEIHRLILLAATVCLIIAIPISLIRSLFFQVGVSLIFAMLAIIRKPHLMGQMILALIGGTVAVILLGNTSVFHTATEAFTSRIQAASNYEGGIAGTLNRFTGGMLEAITNDPNLPFFGYGIGLGTNVGAMLQTGKRTFLIAEGEWGRTIGEMGVFFGLSIIFIRVALTVKIFLVSYQRLTKNDLLPWMLISFGILTITQAQWAQPTALGFSTLLGGLMLASLRNSKPAGEKKSV